MCVSGWPCHPVTFWSTFSALLAVWGSGSVLLSPFLAHFTWRLRGVVPPAPLLSLAKPIGVCLF